MTSERDVVMLSAFQHYLFCPRQCALIHNEGVWSENFLTSAGRVLHKHVDGGETCLRKDVFRATSLRLSSRQHGLVGIADMVEFRLQTSACDSTGRAIAAVLPGRAGLWAPFPVEYKRGKPKLHRADEVQLCAQGLCLEEMLGVAIPQGALFYGETRRRVGVAFDEELKRLTVETIHAVRELLDAGRLPPPLIQPGCDACSLVDDCMPSCTHGKKQASRWISRAVAEVVDT